MTKQEEKIKKMRKMAKKRTGEFVCEKCKEVTPNDKKEQNAQNLANQGG